MKQDPLESAATLKFIQTNNLQNLEYVGLFPRSWVNPPPKKISDQKPTGRHAIYGFKPGCFHQGPGGDWDAGGVAEVGSDGC